MPQRLKSPPPLPLPVQALWDKVRHDPLLCFEDPMLAVQLDPNNYVPFPTLGLLPPGASRADYVLVGSEPYDRWVINAGGRKSAGVLIDRGLRNFAGGRDESCLQYARRVALQVV